MKETTPGILRQQLLGQTGVVAWMTGLPSAGKSTVSRAAEQLLLRQGRLALVLDGDEMRAGLCRDLRFSAEDRTENIRRMAEVARLLAESGLIVLVAVISPLRAHREAARAIAGRTPFLEVFIHSDIATCEQRDPKGNYAKARSGHLRDFTGISAPYEEPEHPDLELDTRSLSIEESAQRLTAALIARSVP